MSAGALYFIRDELKAEFEDEVKYLKLKVREIAPEVYFSEQVERLYWVLDFWPVETLDFISISDAAKRLRQKARHWAYAGYRNYRRGQLIAEELRAVFHKPLTFPVPAGKMGVAAFTLREPNSLFYSEQPLKRRFAGGVVRFVEDKTGPPSRAYLKMWEALALTGLTLDAADRVIDLGATPGGWSYVAASLGAQVLMVDRSEPDAKLLRQFGKLRFLRGDGLNPPEDELNQASFIMSDMACEPQKLFLAVERWLQLRQLRAMVCTLKFHGVSDKGLIRKFTAIQGAEIYHLYHNGHELTWVWQRPV